MRGSRRGLSLLEVVLSLGLAAIAISLLAQLVRIGIQSAAMARDLSKAQLVAESVMAESTSGITDPVSTSGVYEFDESWSYAVDVVPNASQTINIITVTVTQNVEEADNPATFTITQWLAIPPEPEEEEALDTEAGA